MIMDYRTFVLVCSKTPQIGWLKPQTFLTVLETGKFKIKVLADLVSVENPLLGFQTDGLFAVSSQGGEGGGSGLF